MVASQRFARHDQPVQRLWIARWAIGSPAIGAVDLNLDQRKKRGCDQHRYDEKDEVQAAFYFVSCGNQRKSMTENAFSRASNRCWVFAIKSISMRLETLRISGRHPECAVEVL